MTFYSNNDMFLLFFLTEVYLPFQESYWSCICVIGVSILSLYTNLIFDFETLPTVWYYEVFMLLLKFVFFSEYIQQNR